MKKSNKNDRKQERKQEKKKKDRQTEKRNVCETYLKRTELQFLFFHRNTSQASARSAGNRSDNAQVAAAIVGARCACCSIATRATETSMRKAQRFCGWSTP